MKTVRWFVLIVVYLAGVIGNAGFVNADYRGRYPDIDQSPRQARRDFAFAIGFSMVPPAWLITPFLTGFYYHGWTLDSHPFPCTRDPQIWCKP